MLVSNTSTLVLLAKINCLESFLEIAPPIEIPLEVRNEATFHKGSYYARVIQKLIQENKILLKKIEKRRLAPIMNEFRLDEGEAATYILFTPKNHKAILTDDGELIKLCKLERIPFICAMAVVIRLYEKKKLTKELTLSKLELLYSVGRYSKQLYEHFKLEVN